MNLQEYIASKLHDLEKYGVFDVATETVRCWIDEFHDLQENKQS